jgi:hypothetical protein
LSIPNFVELRTLYEPNQQQIDNRQPTNSILHVSHTTSSHVHDNGMKSTSFAGHTPFPHKSITGVRNMEGSTRETKLVEQVNGHCLIKASENVSVVESVRLLDPCHQFPSR